MIFHLHSRNIPSKQIISHIPDGLNELLSDIAREVLRAQPVNCYEFIADYLDVMVETSHKLLAVDDTTFDMQITVADLLREIGITLEQAKQIVEILQEEFKLLSQMKDSRSPEIVKKSENKILTNTSELFKEEDARNKVTEIIQKIYSRYYEKDDKNDNNTLNRCTIEPQEIVQLNENATKIQASYRARLNKKAFQAKRNAAIKIQTAYRGRLSKKEFQAKRDAVVKIQTCIKKYLIRKNIAVEQNMKMFTEDVVGDIIARIPSNTSAEACMKLFAKDVFGDIVARIPPNTSTEACQIMRNFTEEMVESIIENSAYINNSQNAI